jgi:hypothetical protein
MAKTMLNQTTSRPMYYTYAQEVIAKTPSKWLEPKLDAIEDFLATIPKIKEIVTKKITNLVPQSDLDVLSKYDATESESCFWFTDREDMLNQDNYSARKDEKSVYANFACDGYGSYYNYGSSKREIGNLSTEDLIALYFEDMVANGIDVIKYKYVQDNEKDYNGKRMTTYHTEIRGIADKINAYQQKFFDDNDLSMSFTVPKSRHSCHQRARLISSDELAVFDEYLSGLERIRLKWHKHYEEMKEKFKAYAELIRSSKTVEQVEEVWTEAVNIRHKVKGTGTALALSSISQSVIQQDMEARKLADTVAVVVTPKENVGV